MGPFRVGYFVGSLSTQSINRVLSKALIKLAPADLEFFEIPIGDLPLYNRDLDENMPSEVVALKKAIESAQALLFITPEYNRAVPSALKNAIDWGTRPYGHNSFNHIPAAIIGASTGKIGTALAQQNLRSILAFCNVRQMTAPEAYIQYKSDMFSADGDVLIDSTRAFLTDFMNEFRDHVARVLTVLPR